MLVVNGSDARLVYSPQFFSSAYSVYGEGAIFAIVAHVYGHAINETTAAKWLKPAWAPELRADAWAGCALAKSDLNESALIAGLAALSMYRAPAHPGWNIRLPVVRAGFTQCGGDAAKFDGLTRKK